MMQVTPFEGVPVRRPWLDEMPVLDATVGNRQQTTLRRGSRAWTLRKVRFLPTALTESLGYSTRWNSIR
jgi:hypothetical protein